MENEPMLEVGAVVTLMSGGPRMTIYAINTDEVKAIVGYFHPTTATYHELEEMPLKALRIVNE